MPLEEFFKIINIYSLPGFFSGLIFLIIGLIVWLKNRTEKKNIAFLSISVVVFIWLTGFSLGYSVKDPALAMLLFKISYFFVMLIAILVTHFVALFLNYEKRIRGWIVFGYIFFGFTAAVNISTPLAIKGISEYFWGYYPDFNTWFNAVFLAVFMVYVVFAIFLAASALFKKQKDLSEVETKRIKFVIAGLIIFSIACVDFIPGYGIEIYPFGYLLALIFALLTSYAVFRYGAFESLEILRKKEIIEAFKKGEDRYVELIENTPLCIKVFDKNGNLIFLNKGGREEHFLEGKSEEEIKKWYWLGTIKEKYREKATDIFNKALQGEAGIIEFEHTPEGSKHQWCSGMVSPVKDKDGKIKSILFYSTDITALKKEEIRAAEKERIFKALVDSVPMCIKWFDKDGNFSSVNKTCIQEHFLEGKSEEELKKWDYMSTIVEELRSEVSEKMKNVFKGDYSDFEIKHVPGTSKGEWCHSSLVPIKDESGNVAGALFISRDITEEKKLEEERKKNLEKMEETKIALFNILEDAKESEKKLHEEKERSQTIITSMGEGLLVIDADFKIILANRVAQKFFEMAEEEIISKPIEKVFKIYKGDKLLKFNDSSIIEPLKSTGVVVFSLKDDIYYKPAPGKKIPLSLSLAPLKKENENILGIIAIFRDITEEKNLDRAKSDFISVASHQLRTPLTSIKWFSELFLDGDAGPVSDKQKSFLEDIHSNTIRMADLINLLLQIARVEAGRLKIEPEKINLKNLAEEIAAAMKPILGKKSQKIEISSKPEILSSISVDKEIMWQVIQNLISNASRYSPQGWSILISIIQKGDDIEFSVKDNGIGIPKEQQKMIFEKFFRADNARKSVPEGSGLGLSLIKMLVEEWGGKIWFESEEGKGTTFYFTIPIKGMLKKKGEVAITV